MLTKTIEHYDWPMYNRLDIADFDYFHSTSDEKANIKNDFKQLLEDASLNPTKDDQKTLSFKSPFLRGCIRVSKNCGQAGHITPQKGER